MLLERSLGIQEIKRLYNRLPDSCDPADFLRDALRVLAIEHSIDQDDLNTIPAKGPTIVVANHPFGGIDGVLLASLLCSVRKDVKILANFFLGKVPDLQPLLIKIDPFERKSSIKQNRVALREAVRWVKEGGVLLVFPAGEVSHFRWGNRKIEDPYWHTTVARLIRWTQATVIPAYFKGRNSLIFQIAGLVHPLLRTILLPRELLKKRATRINLKIGSPIPFKRLAAITKDNDLTAYLRFRTYLLGNAFAKTPGFLNTPEKIFKIQKNLDPIVPPSSPHRLAREIDDLPGQQMLISSKDLSVFSAHAGQIPNLLEEIGRLREHTFRRVGEGTGKSIDLDRFDQHYIHLFVWNHKKEEIAGAYRLAPSDEILRRFGREGLYTYTLFKYRDRLLRQIGPALEMSRSFVVPGYQKNYAPLMLLWKGIGQFVVRYPRYKILFGAVSITNEYKSYSRQLMAAFLESNNFLQDLAELIRPRKPFRQKPIPELINQKTQHWPGDIDELSSWIAGIETDGKGVPILLKQYVKLGGKLLGFNIDPSFGNVLDGLMMVDLRHTDPKILKRYMGSEGFSLFMSYHRELDETFPFAAPAPESA
jgi:putative hemolysin